MQFPVANPGETEATFAPKLDQSFPGLSTSVPLVREFLLSIQQFNGERWLWQLSELTNVNKHRTLSRQELGEFHSVLVRCGDAGVRLGELGLRSLNLEAGGVLRFASSDGQQADLTGPRVLDPDTVSLAGIDGRIEVVREKRQLYRIPGHDESIAGMLWSIDKNVFRAVHSLHNLLSQT